MTKSFIILVCTVFGLSRVVCCLQVPVSAHSAPRGCFRSECCTSGEPMAAPRLSFLLYPPITDHEAGQAASIVFHVFGVTGHGFESCPASICGTRSMRKPSWRQQREQHSVEIGAMLQFHMYRHGQFTVYLTDSWLCNCKNSTRRTSVIQTNC